MERLAFRNFRMVDFAGDDFGSLIVEGGRIVKVMGGVGKRPEADITIDGKNLPKTAVLMPAFTDLHAHFREPGFPQKETLESASLSAVAGGFVTAVCMANTDPVMDLAEKTSALKARSDSLGLLDLYPVMSLTRGMEGRELSGIRDLRPGGKGERQFRSVLMLSEDGKDVLDEGIFLAAMAEAKRLGLPVSCHCDAGDTEADAVSRAIELGCKAGCHVHIAHVSTKESLKVIRRAKGSKYVDLGFLLTCEVTPHHLGATVEDAVRMGEESFGRVNPPLATEEDRRAVEEALLDGTVDAIATDHAPHSRTDKISGAPGFTGFDAAFAVCLTRLADMGLSRLSALMSANPARILGLHDRGRLAEDLRADLVIVDTDARWTVDPARFKSKGKCTPFEGRELRGKVLMTVNRGRFVYQGGSDA